MRSLLVLTSILAFAAPASFAAAQPARDAGLLIPGGVHIGSVIKDAKGQALGVVERLVGLAGGPPTQVQIRDGSVLRTLPIKGLTPEGGAYMTVLTRAEFQALPPAD